LVSTASSSVQFPRKTDNAAVTVVSGVRLPSTPPISDYFDDLSLLRLRPNVLRRALTDLHQLLFGGYFVEQRSYPKQETVFFLFQPRADHCERKQQHPNPRIRRSHKSDHGQFQASGGPKCDTGGQCPGGA